MNRKEIKQMAKDQIKESYWNLALISAIIAVVTYVACCIVGATLIGAVLALYIPGIVGFSYYLNHINLSNGQNPTVADSFSAFHNFVPVLKLTFFANTFVYLWSLLFFVPGYIKGLSYSQAQFILAENPDMDARDAIKASMEMMEGHKMEYFKLRLSFLGWKLLAVCTCGIGMIFLAPYEYQTYANYYYALKSGK